MKEKVFYIPVNTKKPADTKIHKKRISREKIRAVMLGISLMGVGILSAVISGDGTAMIMTFFIGLAAIIG